MVLYTGISPKDGRSHAVHQLVCRAFHGEPKPGWEVDHGDGDKTNNRAGNLQWVTSQENSIRASRSGRLVAHKGSAHSNAKLSDGDVRAIRSAQRRYGELRRLAQQYGVSETTIRNIRNGITYRDVKPNP